MSSSKLVLQGAAGALGGGGLNVEEVFSTYLYEGTGSAQTITNGIDLDGEGGLVWFKNRTTSNTYHALYDTERGTEKYLMTNVTSAEQTYLNNGVTSFNSDGFVVKGTSDWFNASGEDIASWTFRKAPKFFDVVTYTGDGSGDWDTREISHDLGSTPGFIIIKRTDSADDWWCAARKSSTQYAVSTNGATNPFGINTTNSAGAGSISDCATDTVFMPGFIAQTSDANVNNANYIAYLFAHNDGDGEFGPDADADIIKCGSYTGTGTDQEINLGFEPQWVMIKRSDSAGNGWFIIDTMRGWTNSSADDPFLRAESSQQEYANPYATPLATGFQLTTSNSSFNASGGTYIYIAIRRGPMAVPEDATDVFAQQDPGFPVDSNGLAFTSNFPVDFALLKERTNSSDGWYGMSRLQGSGNFMQTNSTAAETSGVSYGTFDHNTGWYSTASASMSWMWRRAPNYFDVVAYTGTLGADTISHNLGVVPEMIWVKNRVRGNSIPARGNWNVYHSSVSNGYLILNDTSALATSDAASKFGNGSSLVAPTATDFTVADDYTVGRNGDTYIAYLFASLDGVSKVGSFTGNGTTVNVDCGFSSGARFVMTKRTDAGSDWVVWDTERGIVAGNDPFLVLNDVNEESSSYDNIDPYSSGFSLNYDGAATNISGASYIFYAIA